MSKAKPSYGNDSISSLKGADRVRKRPGVIFGSDGLEGCEHAVFEILSNSIDEAREGYGTDITTVRSSEGDSIAGTLTEEQSARMTAPNSGDYSITFTTAKAVTAKIKIVTDPK